MKKIKQFSRFTDMLSTEQVEKLFSARVIVFGLGGVGGAVAHMLVRSGISNLVIVDFDKIDETNINRQFVANIHNVGELKTDEMSKQLKDINPDINLTVYNLKLDENTISRIDFDNIDYVVDCIDDVSAKKLLIRKAKEKNIPILCAMGAGNRYDEIPHFEIADISKTSYDKLAKAMRKFCEIENIKNVNVCYTKQKPIKFDCKNILSVVYYPVNMATIMTAKVINDIIK